jgi:hypothetical protein
MVCSFWFVYDLELELRQYLCLLGLIGYKYFCSYKILKGFVVKHNLGSVKQPFKVYMLMLKTKDDC